MKLARFERDGRVQCGIVAADGIVPVSPALERLGRDPEMDMTALIGMFDDARDELEAESRAGAVLPLEAVRLRAPLARPRTILCAAANYWEHAQREQRPLHMFVKNPDAVIGPGDTIELPETTDPWIFMHEAELALVLRAPRTGQRSQLARRGVRLHRPDRRLGAGAGTVELGRVQLAGEVV